MVSFAIAIVAAADKLRYSLLSMEGSRRQTKKIWIGMHISSSSLCCAYFSGLGQHSGITYGCYNLQRMSTSIFIFAQFQQSKCRRLRNWIFWTRQIQNLDKPLFKVSANVKTYAALLFCLCMHVQFPRKLNRLLDALSRNGVRMGRHEDRYS